ncbi:MAG: CARDB domain-containing protein [Candidatus Micrarchaeia archaeon]
MNMKMAVLYILAVLIIVAVVYIAASYFVPHTYSISVKSMLLNNQTLYPFSIARFKVLVNNTGSNYVKNLSLVLYLNNVRVNNSYSISLPPHENTSLNFTYMIPSYLYGNLTFKAIADPASLLNIANRSKASSTLVLYINKPEAPNVYSSIPNNQIALTRSFSLDAEGIPPALYVSREYNLSKVDFFDINANNNALFSMFGSLLDYIYAMNGAYAKYTNNTSIYTIWIQGSIDEKVISSMLQKLNLNVSSYNNTIFSKLNNNTSLCAYYQGGWTKMLIVSNSTSSNCLSFIKNYEPVESNIILNSLKSSNTIMQMQSRFIYSNSINVGSSIFLDNNSIALLNISILNISKANKGYFFSYIQKDNHNVSNSAILPCNGVVFNSLNTSICSIVTPEAVAPFNYSMMLINSTEMKGNYILTLYSLINRTIAPNAQQGSAGIISEFNIPGVVQRFESTIFKNMCSIIGNNDLSCNIINASSNSTYISVKNLNTLPIHLNSIACYLPGFEKNESINEVVASNQTVSIKAKCLGGTVSFINPLIDYNLTINYTINNQPILANGIVEISGS